MKKNLRKKGEYHGVREIARRAGVAIATVDRVLHNRPGVSEKTTKKIKVIIKELDYHPNILASRLASKKIFNFAVLIPRVSEETDFWQAPLNGIRRANAAVKEYGIKIDLYFFDLNSKKSFELQTKRILKNKTDGVLLAPSFINSAIQFTDICRERNIPYVLIDSNIPDQEGLCYIGPDLFRSGYLSAQLVNFTLAAKSEILVVNIASEVDDHNSLVPIEEGFRAYFKDQNLRHHITNLNIRPTNQLSVEEELSEGFKKRLRPKAIFVTNSRVSVVARYLEKIDKKDIFLIGFDFLKENIEYLEKKVIDILICHKSEEQGYRGVMTLYQHLVLRSAIEKICFMPIDIITKENYDFYHN